MRVPLSLLLSFCDPGLSPEEIASVLALSGTEVERVTTLGVADTAGFVVGRVLAAEQHPDADRLRVCSVETGDAEPTQIVCGAPNVAAGQTVAVALPGAVMPSGMKIKSAKLRGVSSEGMICGEDELGLGPGGTGILVLADGSADPGTPLADVLRLGETVLELEITPNRPDCLGVYGVARELHAATGAALAPEPWLTDLGSEGPLDGVTVTVDADQLCPRFTARVYEGIGSAETPSDIRAHLTAAGMRPISPIVDITNYTMLVTGEPLHAFDLDRIEGGVLRVRESAEGEEITSLDGETRLLQAGEPLICDEVGPTSIAGIMGGARSEVGPETRRVLLEAAVWNGPAINRASTRLGLRSEASGRFEKSLASVQTDRGQAFASQLFDRIFGVTPASGTIAIGDHPASVEIELTVEKVEALMGSSLGEARIREPLERLGFAVVRAESGFRVSVPADRLDVTRDVDLIEEIARIDGLDAVPAKLPAVSTAGGRLTRSQSIRRRVADGLCAAGCWEIAGWNFTSPAVWDRLLLPESDSRRDAVTLRNPMSVEESLMRTTLLVSLLDAAAGNAARGIASIRLFETGPVFLKQQGDLASEPQRVGAIVAGSVGPEDWRNQSHADIDFHGGLGVLAHVLNGLHCEWSVASAAVPEPFLHPGRSGELILNGARAGWVGELHPVVASNWGLETAFAFELDLEAVVESIPEVVHFVPYSQQPSVGQDLAVFVPEGVSAGRLVEIAQSVGGPDLESVSVFDRYAGPGVDAGLVSIGLRLIFRAADRSLTEDEVSESRLEILTALEAQIGAKARV